jgi:phospholipid/cholesterol/gamma-HCH transport system substrate-binding protein
MDQSQSLDIPPRKVLTVEFMVGLFMLAAVLASAWLAVGLGEVKLLGSNSYTIYAEFDNISGLKSGASVEIAGVPVGEVSNISLKDPAARITLKINNGVPIHDDDIAAIRTKGIIGDRYVKISRGGSSSNVKVGGTLYDTEGVVDIEDIIGKIVHSLSGSKDKDEDQDKAKK